MGRHLSRVCILDAPVLATLNGGKQLLACLEIQTLHTNVTAFRRRLLYFDLVAVGRAVLADPYWGAKVADGRLGEIRPYDKSADARLY